MLQCAAPLAAIPLRRNKSEIGGIVERLPLFPQQPGGKSGAEIRVPSLHCACKFLTVIRLGRHRLQVARSPQQLCPLAGQSGARIAFRNQTQLMPRRRNQGAGASGEVGGHLRFWL